MASEKHAEDSCCYADCCILREVKQERDAALALAARRKEFIDDYQDELKKAQEGEEYWRQAGNRLCKERDEARAALKMLWTSATYGRPDDSADIAPWTRAAVKAVLGNDG